MTFTISVSDQLRNRSPQLADSAVTGSLRLKKGYPNGLTHETLRDIGVGSCKYV